MTLTLEPYHVFLIVTAIIGAFFTMFKMLGSQINANLQHNFAATNERIERVSKQNEKSQDDLRELERKFHQFEVSLPKNYVHRDDFVRSQSIIEAKLDSVASKLETVQIRQGVLK
ncbi:hypothetical protein F892_03098 [Acinetobacter vivianii]|uniref:Uncharacterized protein n=1 Tax=Acinetobacter vivianii TaxID=1776742 RepID=N9Q125_9GAMM|nr:hypothetical protein [Acinetobacter vivianii]ENX20175.1 hypothetical protein F892_03098 [Acinetobacter vivianii]GGI59377.1 membrane protein [Acinetobacter vivianii]